jgi:hypothetical protein
VSDDLPPHGVRRPNPADLIDLDEVGAACLDARTLIRGWIAAAHDRVSMWQLPCPPGRRPDPVSAGQVGAQRRPI